MREKKRIELHVVIDDSGIKTIQIHGDPGVENHGKEMYEKIKDLLPRWNREIQRVFENEKFEFVVNIH
ncbi:MAG TPA: hypothetical protein VHT73_10285 [Thermodesulfobacteriota bacterium]|nr:hypothetical protein [Thermodesulfobacteriota bacterium]